ncbi:MAG: glycosyltransferase family 1 protein, partial [Chloroflexi bacterium]
VLALLRRQGRDVRLVLAGGKGWLYEGFFRKLERFPHREAVRWLGYVPDEDLPALYSAATLCVVPSLYEGFGLPVLEAMACGTPVVCSRSSSLPEVGGAAARYFDPNDVEAMAAVIGAVWQDDDAQAAMREQGLAQAARFSWERAAEETMAVYRGLRG